MNNVVIYSLIFVFLFQTQEREQDSDSISLMSGGSNDNYKPLYDVNAHHENWNHNKYDLTTSQALRFGTSVRELYSLMNAVKSD